MARKNLYINNTNIGTYGIYISSDTYLNSPSFDYVEYTIPGQNGNVIQYNNRLNNVIRKFTCYIPSLENVQTSFIKLKKLIYANPGYMKLSSDYESGTYQFGYLAQEISVNPFNQGQTATFDLYFSCLPQKYYSDDVQKNLGGFSTGYEELLVKNDSKIGTMVRNNTVIGLNSNIGWITFGMTSAISGTGDVVVTSSTTPEFAVYESYTSGGQSYYAWIGETQSGSLTVQNYAAHGGILLGLFPIKDSLDIQGSFSFNNSAPYSQTYSWPKITSAELTNSTAFGMSPQVLFEIKIKSINTDLLANLEYCFVLGDMFVLFKFDDLYGKYGNDYILDNFTYTVGADSFISIKLDLKDRIAYLLNGSDLDDDVLFDVSGYVQFINEFNFNENTLSIKAQEFTEWTNAMLYVRPSNVNVKMDWWTL